VAPASLHDALVVAKQLSDWHGEAATQRAMAHLIDEGLLARHVRKASKEYAARHAALVEACDEHVGGSLTRVPSAAGLHLALRCPDDTPADLPGRVVAAADRQGVVVEDLGRYGADGAVLRGFALGFGLIRADDVRHGVRTFAQVLRSSSG
jgi:GntR family transcriptional regulator/MocR family aminotransferase